MHLSHWSEDGNLRMIDVSDKSITKRQAKASGKIFMRGSTIKEITSGTSPKGDVLTVAKINGIQAAKNTSALIPLCHPLNITHCDIIFNVNKDNIEVISIVKTEAKTGVEMEALTSVSVSLLTIYDMLKPIDKKMVISDIKLEEKEGGKSGKWKRE